jgi:hypothetical protein
MNNLAAASKEILVIRGQSRAVNDNLLCTVGAHICSGHSFDIETHGRISPQICILEVHLGHRLSRWGVRLRAESDAPPPQMWIASDTFPCDFDIYKTVSTLFEG